MSKKYGRKAPIPFYVFPELIGTSDDRKPTLLSYFPSLPKDEVHANKEMQSPNQLLTKKKQLCLRLGQKEHFLTECSGCGMAYNPSCNEDTKIHIKFHKRCLQ